MACAQSLVAFCLAMPNPLGYSEDLPQGTGSCSKRITPCCQKRGLRSLLHALPPPPLNKLAGLHGAVYDCGSGK